MGSVGTHYSVVPLQGLPPPERFMTRGAVGPYLPFPTLLEDLDLLKEHEVGGV